MRHPCDAPVYPNGWGILAAMDKMLLALGVILLLGLGGVAAWLGAGRAALAAAARGAAEGRQAAEAALARVGECLAAEERLRREAEDQSLVMRGEVEKGAQRHALEMENRAALFRQEMEAMEGAHAAELSRQRAVLAERERGLAEKQALFEKEVRESREQLKAVFGDLAGKALAASTDELLKRAEEKFRAQQQAGGTELEKRREAVEALVKPIGETLKKTDEQLTRMEQARTSATATISEQLRATAEANQYLRAETARLVRALREPHVRGRYGEVQLKRVAELAGMQAYCDFREQDFARDGDGQAVRPDMIVRLPNERVVIVDAKCNIQGYLDALQAATPEEAEEHLDRFARHVAEQAGALAKKKYWTMTDYDGSPEFVVMFIPGDNFIDAALARQPDLLEAAARQNVILASPSTLIGLLRAVAVGYKEQRLAKEAGELRELGMQLHDRASTAFAYAARLGTALETAVSRYNEFVGSYQNRLEPTLERFEGAGVKSGKDLPELGPVTVRARLVGAGEG